MTTALLLAFLALFAATLFFGGWLVTRLTQADARIDGILADAARAEAICDEAENGWAL